MTLLQCTRTHRGNHHFLIIPYCATINACLLDDIYGGERGKGGLQPSYCNPLSRGPLLLNYYHHQHYMRFNDYHKCHQYYLSSQKQKWSKKVGSSWPFKLKGVFLTLSNLPVGAEDHASVILVFYL